MLIIPAIDLRSGKCVRLAQGKKSLMTVYEQDPIETAQNFAAAGAELIHVVDLDRAFGEPQSVNRNVLRQIVASIDVAIEFGGGIRTISEVDQLHDIGVDRVVLGTMAVESMSNLAQLVQRFGSFIAVGIDARDGQVMTRGWEQAVDQDAETLARQVAEVGVDRIVYTDIARDGMLRGINIEQTVAVARAGGIRVTASGGVSSLDDLRLLAATDEVLVDSVIVGKAFYEGRFTFKEASEALQQYSVGL